MASRKLGKLLAFTAVASAAIAAGIAYFKHKSNSEFLDDDMDDFDEDFGEEDFDFPLPTETSENSVKREYVSIHLDKESADKKEQATTEPLSEESLETVTTSDASSEDESNVASI